MVMVSSCLFDGQIYSDGFYWLPLQSLKAILMEIILWKLPEWYQMALFQSLGMCVSTPDSKTHFQQWCMTWISEQTASWWLLHLPWVAPDLRQASVKPPNALLVLFALGVFNSLNCSKAGHGDRDIQWAVQRMWYSKKADSERDMETDSSFWHWENKLLRIIQK